MKKTLTTLALVLTLALTLFGCGKDIPSDDYVRELIEIQFTLKEQEEIFIQEFNLNDDFTLGIMILDEFEITKAELISESQYRVEASILFHFTSDTDKIAKSIVEKMRAHSNENFDDEYIEVLSQSFTRPLEKLFGKSKKGESKFRSGFYIFKRVDGEWILS
ncbi:hypothetical protein RI845_13605 [Thalassotalea nanhaiensis]|uniref:Lipoprotein n=1 Tax=Thalassotalea nanhaiensis TaxID=3065648 RepID=A0ABY9TIC1_9GAMM|nr:hypothetical protein RI845_13605 [Colwelliaceae bacterium SQ345]